MSTIVVAIICILILFLIAAATYDDFYSVAQEEGDENDRKKSEPWVIDTKLKIKVISEGLQSPTSFAFLGPNDILLLDKNEGKMYRITDGELLDEPLLDMSVSNKFERGLLGIAIASNDDGSKHTYVFLYLTESPTGGDGTDVCPVSYHCEPGNEPLGNRLYRFELVNDSQLSNPKLLLDLPATPGPAHNGGKMVIGPDKNLYMSVGDVLGYRNESLKSKVLNFVNGTDADGRGGILRMTQDGQPVGDGILGKDNPLNLYYAYGIRNSFGIAFDPVTGNLWDTENGPDYADEINLVKPGFNSGWIGVQGKWKPYYDEVRGGDFIAGHEIRANHGDSLETFGGKGRYSDPEFTWYNPVGPTGITFFNSDKFGREYENDIFVADVNNGNIYHFDLNEDRTRLSLEGSLKDRVANNIEEVKSRIFAKGFDNGITDIQVGPDGYLYVLSRGKPGALYMITPFK